MIVLLVAALIATPRPPRTAAPRPVPVEPQELTDAQVREQVQAYLGSIDTPIREDHWKSLGPRAAAILEEVIADPAQLPTTRAKAVDGLVAAAPARAAALVGRIARDEKEPVIVRVAALHGAGQVLPGQKTLTELRPVLRTAKSAGLRAEAAEVMSRKKGGCLEIRDQVAREKEESRVAFRRALDRCAE